MQLKFSCPPHLADVLPKPILAKEMMPGWFKDMRHQVTIDGENRPTAKQCPPFSDVMLSGFYFRLSCDIMFDGQYFSWDQSAQRTTSTPFLTGPMSFHQQAELDGSPLVDKMTRIVKFHNYWCVQAEAGWSLLCLHPAHQANTPFKVISAVVDIDQYRNVPIQIPATWHTSEPCRLMKGTAIAQCIPIKRERIDMEISTMSMIEYKFSTSQAMEVLMIPHVYRRKFRARK